MEKFYPLRQLFWELTLRCNLKCLHCGSECQVDSAAPDMPLEHILPVLDEIHSRQPHVKCIVVTAGGEPLVRPDILECGLKIRKAGFYWGMVTNGMLLDRTMTEGLIDCGLSALSVDIDGLPAQHNWLRQSQVSFDRVYNSLQYIRRSSGLVWDVITCVNNRNLGSLPQIKKMLIDAGVKQWRVFTIVPMGRAQNNRDLVLDARQFKELMDFISITRKEGNINLSFSCEGYLGEYELKVRDYPFLCQAGYNTASIRINGDISGCLSVRAEYDQGNIYKDSFWDVWTNRFEKYRNHEWKKTGICAHCKVFERCKGNGMHLRRSDGSLMRCHYQSLENINF